jgi:hypothetical protein
MQALLQQEFLVYYAFSPSKLRTTTTCPRKCKYCLLYHILPIPSNLQFFHHLSRHKNIAALEPGGDG